MNMLTGALAAALAAGFIFLFVLAVTGRTTEPWNRARAEAYERRRYPVALRRACDMAIAEARRRARPGEPAIVTVADVLDLMEEHFGFPDVTRYEASAALRERFAARGCDADCVTDA
ncbi:hypothetical protein [Streptomyces sp. NPDC102360]|uniref:hypothetical protein n=1 Tax=Streptomyces sp. NPDC102360 TaxID=3366160 RepID=UPI003804E2C7